MILPPTIDRCHDEKCEVKAHCLRWTQRAGGDASTKHATTLRPMWQVFSELCDHAITEGEIE